MSQSELGRQLGLSRSMISRFVNGSLVPTLADAAKIEVMTKGKVKAVEWMDPLENREIGNFAAA